MTKKDKKTIVPAERLDTIRHLIIKALSLGPISAKEISGEVGISEKEVAGHLLHIERSLHSGEKRLFVTPASCRSCGFEYKKRERLSTPGKCPICDSEQIEPLLFEVRVRDIVKE